MKTHKVLAAAAALALGTLGLSACGNGNDAGNNSSGDAGASGGTQTLQFWHNATQGPGTAFWEKTVADFEAAHPGVKIEIQVVQNEDLDGKLQTALNSGDAPDIFFQRGGGKMAAMVKAGQLMDLSSLITPETKSAIGDAALGAESLDAKVYAVPTSLLPEGFFYSQDLFKEAGVTATPTTLDELNDAIAKLKAKNITPIAVGAKDAWPAAHYYYNFALAECSPNALATAADKMTFDDPCWLKAGEDLKAFADTKPFNDGFLTTAAQQGAGSSAGLVANHKASMELMGAWDPGVIASLTPDQQPLPDLGFFPFPSMSGGQGQAGSILAGMDGYSCSAQAPQQACADFLNYIVTTSVQEEYYKAFNALPANTEAQKVVQEPYLQAALKAVNDAPYVSQYLDTIYGQNVGNALNTAVVDLLAGKTDPAGIVTQVNDAAKKA